MIPRLRGNSLAKPMVFSGFLLFVITTCGLRLAVANQIDVEQRVVEQVSRFEGDDWHVRKDAFYRLLDITMPGGFRGRTELLASAVDAFLRDQPAQRERVVTALVALLERENTISRNAPVGSLSEEFVSYLGDLIGATAAMHDQRAVDALVGELGSGNMASKAVAAFGASAVDRVLAVLGPGDIADRIGATRALAQMLDPRIVKIDVASRSKIKAGLLRASKDQHFAVRESAINGLATLPDADVTARLKELAERDPYSQLSDADQSAVYPVRNAASKALAAR